MKNYLPAFVISTLLHAGLFALAYTIFIDKPMALPAARPNPVVLKLAMFVPPSAPEAVVPPPEAILIQKPRPIVKVTKKPKVQSSKPVKNTRPKPEPRRQFETEPVIQPKSAPVVEPEIAVQQPPASPESVADIRVIDEYKLSIRQAIEANKRYPRRARRLRQEGTTVVAFTILNDGSIQNLRVTQSAGANRLDQAAMKAIEKINGRFPLPGELNKTSWDFNVPIQYSLL